MVAAKVLKLVLIRALIIVFYNVYYRVLTNSEQEP